jgi:hypothetical protein
MSPYTRQHDSYEVEKHKVFDEHCQMQMCEHLPLYEFLQQESFYFSEALFEATF